MFTVFSHTADIGLDLQASNLETLFIEAANGWRTMVFEDSEINAVSRHRISLAAADPEDLLVQWLSELNYFLTVHRWVFHAVTALSLQNDDAKWSLRASIDGESLDSDRHYIYFDIKAVTYHQLNIAETADGYRTRVIFDI